MSWKDLNVFATTAGMQRMLKNQPEYLRLLLEPYYMSKPPPLWQRLVKQIRNPLDLLIIIYQKLRTWPGSIPSPPPWSHRNKRGRVSSSSTTWSEINFICAKEDTRSRRPRNRSSLKYKRENRDTQALLSLRGATRRCKSMYLLNLIKDENPGI